MLNTEKRNSKTTSLDSLSTREILEIMNDEDFMVVEAVKRVIPQIEVVSKAMIDILNNAGRIIYAGAGTSGRLAVLDAVECGPTFSCKDEFVALMCGGNDALFKAVEGAEDNKELCVADLKNVGFCSKDFFIGVSASGRTPYVVGGIEYVKKLGAKSACVCCNLDSEIGSMVDFPIEVDCGPEILTGSTRLKSGTAQKMIINMLSTSSMVGVGRVYGNLMVDVCATNEKLYDRCRTIVMEATGCEYEVADRALGLSDNRCKEAIVMIMKDVDFKTAQSLLKDNGGFIRRVIDL